MRECPLVLGSVLASFGNEHDWNWFEVSSYTVFRRKVIKTCQNMEINVKFTWKNFSIIFLDFHFNFPHYKKEENLIWFWDVDFIKVKKEIYLLKNKQHLKVINVIVGMKKINWRYGEWFTYLILTYNEFVKEKETISWRCHRFHVEITYDITNSETTMRAMHLSIY